MLYIEIKNDSFLKFTILSVGLEGNWSDIRCLTVLRKRFFCGLYLTFGLKWGPQIWRPERIFFVQGFVFCEFKNIMSKSKI